MGRYKEKSGEWLTAGRILIGFSGPMLCDPSPELYTKPELPVSAFRPIFRVFLQSKPDLGPWAEASNTFSD